LKSDIINSHGLLERGASYKRRLWQGALDTTLGDKVCQW